MSRRQCYTIERYQCLPNGKVERVSAKQPIQTPARQATLSGTTTRRLQHVEISTLADDSIVHQHKQHNIDVERNYGSQTKKTALDGGQRPEGKLGYQPNPVFPPDFDFAEAANLTDQLLQQVRPRRKKRTINVGVRFLQKQLIADMSFRMNHFIDGSEKLTAILWSSCTSKHGLVQRYAGAVSKTSQQFFAVAHASTGEIFARNA
ncbi:hypothetical protein EDD18DRAFT_1113410 [Armillaria luteobubalina]|uniref:Uncharacterized protein n=1 Tax=Armillaria luteobubalina TaxID=153913 RepID=A0AA39PBH2_9AGAR|nr:hypothetical protein EDD18DRAFT_1113410 [Armillaria luteobubalina]